MWEAGEQEVTHQAFPFIYVADMKMLWDTDVQTYCDFDVPVVIPKFSASMGQITKLDLKRLEVQQ